MSDFKASVTKVVEQAAETAAWSLAEHGPNHEPTLVTRCEVMAYGTTRYKVVIIGPLDGEAE